MFASKKKRHPDSLIACMGKIPLQAEFIKLAVNHPAFVNLDRWYQAGYQQFVQTQGVNAKEIFQTTPWQHFLTFDNTTIKIGSWLPSQDLSQRSYPFVICRLLQNKLVQEFLPLIPLLYQDYFSLSHEFCSLLETFPTVDAMLNQLDNLTAATCELTRPQALQISLQKLTQLTLAEYFNEYQIISEQQPWFVMAAIKLILLINSPALTENFVLKLPLLADEKREISVTFWLQLILVSMKNNKLSHWSAYWDFANFNNTADLLLFFRPLQAPDFNLMVRTNQQISDGVDLWQWITTDDLNINIGKTAHDPNLSLLQALNVWSDIASANADLSPKIFAGWQLKKISKTSIYEPA